MWVGLAYSLLLIVSMKRVLGANTLVLIISVVSTALGGTLLISSLFDGEPEGDRIYTAIHEAFKARDEVSVVNKRMRNINNAVTNELRRGKVLERPVDKEFIFQDKVEETGVNEDERGDSDLQPESVMNANQRVHFIKERLKRYDNRRVKPLRAVLKDIGGAKSPYEKKKKSLALLDKRFIFAWNVNSLKNSISSKLSDSASSSSGKQYVTIKKVNKESDGTKTYDLQVWNADEAGVRREGGEFSVDEWPFVLNAEIDVGRLTDDSSIGRSFVTTDLDIASDIAGDATLVEALVSSQPELEEGEGEDVGRSVVVPVSDSIGISEPDLEENCIEPGVDGCIINVEGEDEFDPIDPFNEMHLESTDWSLG